MIELNIGDEVESNGEQAIIRFVGKNKWGNRTITIKYHNGKIATLRSGTKIRRLSKQQTIEDN